MGKGLVKPHNREFSVEITRSTEDIVKEFSVSFTFSSLDRDDSNNSNVMFSEVNFQSEIIVSI